VYVVLTSMRGRFESLDVNALLKCIGIKENKV
jgi:hypothetical protein